MLRHERLRRLDPAPPTRLRGHRLLTPGTSSCAGTIRHRRSFAAAARRSIGTVNRPSSRTGKDSSTRFPGEINAVTKQILWVPRTLSRHATCTYSWMRPPSRFRRSGRMVAPESGGVAPVGGR